MANNCKYYKQQKQFSTNSGETWSNVIPFEYRRGGLIEADSPDCREEVMITRFVTIPDAFVCDGKVKYEKQVAQYSLDNGETWQYYYPSIYQYGNIIEANADICNNKWEGYYSGDTANICSGHYIYVAGRGCVDGNPVDQHCQQGLRGCIFDPVKYVRCSSTTSTTLTSDDVSYSPYRLYKGYIGDCVTSINTRAFQNCRYLSNITIPNSVTTIGNYAFSDCFGLTSVTIGNGVTSIGNYSFSSCSGLTSIDIPNSVTSIGSWTFYGCNNLEIATIGNGVTSIGDSAFRECSGLTSVQVGNGLKVINNYAFTSCINLSSINLPNGLTTIGNYAFANTSLSHITIPSGSIGLEAFVDNSELVSVTLGNGVTSIGDEAFYNCSGLTSITIPSGVTSLGNWVFVGCPLTSVTCLAETPPTLNGRTFFGATYPIYVPCDSLNLYKESWNQYASRLHGIPPCEEPTGETKWIAYNNGGTVSSALCDSTSGITRYEIPDADCVRVEVGDCVTSIGQGALQGFRSLSSVTISDSVTSIGINTFSGDSRLANITIGSGLTTIGATAFNECTSLTSVSISDIGAWCGINYNTSTSSKPLSFAHRLFLNDQEITDLVIPSSATSIGDYAFGWCNSFSSLTIPNSVTSIGNYAFYGCNSLISVTIPSGITSIGNYVFEACSNMISATIESGSTSIGIGAFRNCTSLTSVTIPNTVTSIGDEAFRNSNSLSSITIPNSVTSIGNGVFSACTSLTNITIPNSVTSIGNRPFRDCSGLTSITCLATTPPSLGTNAFDNTAPDLVIYVPSGSVDAYKSKWPWSLKASIIQPIPTP